MPSLAGSAVGGKAGRSAHAAELIEQRGGGGNKGVGVDIQALDQPALVGALAATGDLDQFKILFQAERNGLG